MSSIRPDVAAELAEAGKAAGIRVLDAPVSGGEAGAIEAVLSIMVGGDQADFDEVKPILDAVGKTVVLVGPAGSGQTVKAANQLIVAGNFELVAEAIVFLRAYGVDTEAALEVLAGGLAGSTVMNRKGASMLAGNFQPGFRIDLHHKDMGIIIDAARAKGVAIPVGAVTAQLIGALRAQGDGGLDHSALLRGVERLSGRSVRRSVDRLRERDEMTKMRAVDAAVKILELEGATQTFGLPGAAINPFYDAMRKPRRASQHVLARHVEGASHMAEGYTRAKAGNIGICIGTSGPAGTDMITGLYSASADSIPILCITGQAPVARLHKEDFQAVDIASIAKPVTKWAATVLEPAQVPGAFQQAFHLMRSGRPGPVLIDLPFDVQMAEIDFDPDTYAPLPVYKPAATRAQIEKALDMLLRRRAPADRRRRRHHQRRRRRPAGRAGRDAERAGRSRP